MKKNKNIMKLFYFILLFLFLNTKLFSQNYIVYDSTITVNEEQSKFLKTLKLFIEKDGDINDYLDLDVILNVNKEDFFIKKEDINPIFNYLLQEYNPTSYKYLYHKKDNHFYIIQCISDNNEIIAIFELNKKLKIDTIHLLY